MKGLMLACLLLAVATSAAGAYLALTPTAALLRGAGPINRPYQPNWLDRAFPAWRRVVGGALVLAAILVAIALIEWPGLS